MLDHWLAASLVATAAGWAGAEIAGWRSPKRANARPARLAMLAGLAALALTVFARLHHAHPHTGGDWIAAIVALQVVAIAGGAVWHARLSRREPRAAAGRPAGEGSR